MNWYCDYLPPEQLVVDASVLINILGCGAPETILRGLQHPALVEERTLREVLRHPLPGQDHTTFFDFAFKSRLLSKVEMCDAEYDTYLGLIQASLGTRLDDGESAALSVASHRRICAVIDEKKARNFAARYFPDLKVVSSLKLLISAAARLNKGSSWAKTTIANAHAHARLAAPKEERQLLSGILANTGGNIER